MHVVNRFIKFGLFFCVIILVLSGCGPENRDKESLPAPTPEPTQVKVLTKEQKSALLSILERKIQRDEQLALALEKRELALLGENAKENALPPESIEHPYENVVYSEIPNAPDFEQNPRIIAKALYVSQNTLGSAKLEDLIGIAETTEINAFVIDIVDDYGNVLFDSATASAICPEANGKSGIRDLPGILQKLKDHQIYLIGRLVTFRAPRYAALYPERGITLVKTGENYKQGDGLAWASAYDEKLWAYVAGISQEAADLGFNEIQYDYVRFPATGKKLDKQLNYHNDKNISRTLAVQQFLLYVKAALAEYPVYITADVFGWAASAPTDIDIGQHWEAISNVVDYIAPMMYPSHYGPNIFGIAVPDAKPYETITRSGQDVLERNAHLKSPALVRPWIQDFTATWVNGHIRYGADELRAQIDALEALGIKEFMIWNPRNNYHVKGLKKEGQ